MRKYIGSYLGIPVYCNIYGHHAKGRMYVASNFFQTHPTSINPTRTVPLSHFVEDERVTNMDKGEAKL